MWGCTEAEEEIGNPIKYQAHALRAFSLKAGMRVAEDNGRAATKLFLCCSIYPPYTQTGMD